MIKRKKIIFRILMATVLLGHSNLIGMSVDIYIEDSIPESGIKNKNALAVVFGVEKYKYVSGSVFAKRDAEWMKKYFENVLGIPSNRIYYKTDDDVTKGAFDRVFSKRGWLYKRANKNTDIYIYYAGHGAPDMKQNKAYLIPYDGDPNYASQTGYAIDVLYAELGNMGAKSVTVFLDACFSGANREKEMLLADARPVFMEVDASATGNVTVFSASGGKEISSAWPEKKHGLFSYFLMKGMRGDADTNKDKQITVGELGDYVKENVSDMAGMIDRKQTPGLQTMDRNKILISVTWESEKLAYPQPQPKLPADLALDIQFSEPSGNNYLDAEETGTVSITITNNGMGEAYAIQPSLSLKTSITGINTGEFELIERLDPSSSKEMQTTISASQYISSETVKFEINISEHNGFDLYPPGKLTIQTRALVPPALALMDVGINDLTNYNGRIEPNEVIEATAIIQNRGQGLAKNVNISIHYGDKVFNAGDAETSFSLGNVQPNETKEISFSFFATRQAETDLPIRLEIKEARGRYDQTVNAGLSLNEVIKKATEVFVAGREQGMVQITDVDAISVDIEENIPKTGMKNVNGIAVVIGNREYGGDVPDVEFAVRDAEYVREYLIKTMGYRPGNIFYYTNATFSNMKVAFKKLKNAVKKEKSDVFIYYSGHGAPDSLSGQGFFVPVDADPTFIKETGYAVKDLYTMLNTLGSKSTTVVIDACFSGSSGGPGSANERMLLKRISPISIHIDKAMLTRENSAVFSSSTGVQVSSWYTEKKHSLFTYYFLKALQGDADSNKDNMLTLSEIKDYIDDKVPYMARRLNNRVQTPQLQTLDRNKVLVNY